MLHKFKIKSYVLIAGLAAVFFLPITVDADRAANRAMKEDGRGLESTRGNNSVAESLKWQDGHPNGDSKNQAAPSSAHAAPIDPATSAYSSDPSAIPMDVESNAKRRDGTSYRHELREKNRLRNGIPGSGLGSSSDPSAIPMGVESNAKRRDGTSYRHELREKNRLRNGTPGSGRKMK